MEIGVCGSPADVEAEGPTCPPQALAAPENTLESIRQASLSLSVSAHCLQVSRARARGAGLTEGQCASFHRLTRV